MGGDRNLDSMAVNTIRTLAIEAVEKAGSGHPGMPLGAAPMAHVLWSRYLRFDPEAQEWADRDRFVLSAGHGSMLLYALLHLAGFGVTVDDIKEFRQWGSITPGHPECGLTPGVEVTTGPLGQGFGNGVGMAAAEEYLAGLFNSGKHRVVDHWTYGIVSDGDLMEGISSEAASLAGHLELGKLIYLYDDNHVSIEGNTEITFTEDVEGRFNAYGWQVLSVEDGNDLEAIDRAIEQAREDEGRPSLIRVRTHIGYGSPNKQDSADAHGAPLGEEEVRLTKEALEWSEEPFFVPPEVKGLYGEAAARGAEERRFWQEEVDALEKEDPAQAEGFFRAMRGDLPEGWLDRLPKFVPADGSLATRKASGQVLNALAPVIPTLVGGSADLAPSNNTMLTDCGESPCGSFQEDSRWGRNFHFGVREHAMGAFLTGMVRHGGVTAYGGTFLVFSDYMRGSIRVAAISHAPVKYVFTHDSVGLGEDGPTHQPIEHLASLRAMPGLTVIRPADAGETVQAWRVALQKDDGPVALVLTRQKLPVLDREVLAPAEELARGAYILAEAPGGADEVDALVLASGSEVHVALEARDTLNAEGVGVRVVSVPSWELFAEQEASYRRHVLPPEASVRVAVEAGVSQGWERFVGDGGSVVGIDRFGASAPGDRVLAEYGITAGAVVGRVRSLLGSSG